MRTATAGELATLASRSRSHTARIKVANGSGTLVDYSRWFNAAKISHDIDQPVSGATVSFIRSQGTTQSLAPLRTDSTLNRLDDGTTYAPALDLNRRITIEVATTAIGAPVLAADYKMLFDGTVDIVNFERNPVVLECRDKGAPLVNRWVETEAFYGTTPVGTAIETVMQDIIDDVFGVGVHVLYVPVSPSFLIVQYRQQKMSVMDALTDLVQLIGWDVRYKWDDTTSAFRLTLSEPSRTKTVPDYTFGPGAYIDIGNLGLELTNIRNVVQVSYKNSADLGNRAVVTVTDAPSITKYGRRFFLIQEADSSPIDTAAEATTMANAALSDLKDPKAEQGKNAPLFWPADISDLYRYTNNSVHYDSNQDWAVVEFDHEIAIDHMRTNFKVRGGPAGAYNSWLGRGGTIGGGGGVSTAFPPRPYISPLNTEGDELDWDLRFNSVLGSGGGGTNLTYTIKLKKTFATESTLSSGNASAFPLDLTVARDIKEAAVLTFRVVDAATGMFAEVTYPIPAYTPAIEAGTGFVLGGQIKSLSVGTGALADTAITTAKIADANVTPAKTQARSRCRLYKNSQTLTTATITILAFENESFDVGGLHDPATNNSRITIPTGGDTGTWFFSAQVGFNSTSTAGDRAVYLYKNGAAVAVVLVAAASANATAIHISWIDSAPTVGDYYEVAAFQDSGGNLGLLVNALETWFSALHLW